MNSAAQLFGFQTYEACISCKSLIKPVLRVCVLAGLELALLGVGEGRAQYLQVAGEGCSDQSGILAYRFVQGDSTQVTAVKCSSNTVQVLFTKRIPDDVVLPPLCVSNGVIVVSVDGLVTKYGLDGKQVFSVRALRAGEVSRLAGRWDSGTVYLTGMAYEGAERKARYRLVWVDVSSSALTLRGEVDTGEPMRVFRVGSDIVVCGRRNTERVAAPVEVAGEQVVGNHSTK